MITINNNEKDNKVKLVVKPVKKNKLKVEYYIKVNINVQYKMNKIKAVCLELNIILQSEKIKSKIKYQEE